MRLDERRKLGGLTLIEPLAGGWPAWWGTVAPVPASLHLARSQLPSLRQYLDRMAGEAAGSSDAVTADRVAARVAQVRAAKGAFETRLRNNVELAHAWEHFQAILVGEAQGQPLESFYPRLPPPLRGLVELVYDYHSRPHLRVLEPLAYRSSYYRPELQSFRFSHLQADKRRSFFLSLPRPPAENDWEWMVPFDDERVDALFRLDTEAQPVGRILDLLGASADDPGVLRYFAEAETPPRPRWSGPGGRIQYLGHAGVLVETPGVCVLVDPFLTVQPERGGPPRTTFQDLPPAIDYVLVTHAHPDHLVLESLIRLRHRIGTVVVPRSTGLLVGDVSLKLLLRTIGFRQVIEMDTLDALPIQGGEIVAVPFMGEHGDLAHSKTGYLVRLERDSLLFAADSACLDEQVYASVRSAVGRVATIFLTTEATGANLTYTIEALFPSQRDRSRENARRCRGGNAGEGLRLLELLGAERVYVYALGLEEWTQHVLGPAAATDASRIEESDSLLVRAKKLGLAAERLCGPQEIPLS